MNDNTRLPEFGPMGRNSTRVKRQNDLLIEVIVGNPPWSAGQKSAGDDNPNIDYPALAARVRETYGQRHRDVTGRGAGKSAGNLYVQAIRWASDRLNGVGDESARPGVVAFVHPNSLSNGTSLAGMRAALRDEFSDIYVVNLRGDAMKSGDEFRREGDKIFGAGSRNGVQVTVLVRNPQRDLSQPAALHYAEVPEYSKLDAKLAWLDRLGDVTADEFRTVPLNYEHHWVNLTDGTFEQLLPVCAIDRRETEVAVLSHASGVNSGSDAYVYSFDREALIIRAKTLIDSYEDARQLMKLGLDLDDVSENDQLECIKWTPTLRQALKRGDRLEFDESRIRECLYRPFTRLWLYADERILVSLRSVASMFEDRPTDRPTNRPTDRPTNQPTNQPTNRSGSSLFSEPIPGRVLLRGSTEQPSDLRHARSRSSYGLLRSRPQSAVSNHPETAIAMAGPSNMAIFGALSTEILPDLHLMGPGQQSRAIHRRIARPT